MWPSGFPSPGKLENAAGGAICLFWIFLGSGVGRRNCSLAYLHVISFLLVPSEDPGHFMICRINARRLFLMRHATVHSNLLVEFNGEEWASPKLNLFRGRNVEIRKLLTFYEGAKRGNNDKNSEARCLRDSSSTSITVGVSSLGSKNKIVTLTILKKSIIQGVLKWSYFEFGA